MADVIVPALVEQHRVELGGLWMTRQTIMNARSTTRRQLTTLDERIDAHHDGCVIAGECGKQRLLRQLDEPEPTDVFAAALVALETHDLNVLDRCLAAAERDPSLSSALVSALGWIERRHLQGLIVGWLTADESYRRFVGVAACAEHRVDPGSATAKYLDDLSKGGRG